MANEEKQEQVEKQKPKKPRGQKSGEGMKLPVIIGIILGIVIVFIVAIRFLFLPYLVESLGGDPHAGDKSEQVEGKDEKSESGKEGHDGDEIPEEEGEEDLMFEKEGVHFIKTGRITTNPKGSNRIVILDIGLQLRVIPEKNEDGEEIAEEQKGEFKLEEVLDAKMKASINKIIGSMTETEIHEKRDSLAILFKNELKPIFRKNRMYLRELFVQDFLIQ